MSFSAGLASCSLFEQRKAPQNKVTQKDVPVAARESKMAEPKKRVIVLPFLDVSTERSSDVAQVARKTLVQQLLATGQFVVVDNGDFPKDLGSYKTNDEYDLKEVAKAAAGLGVAAIIEGKILDVQARRLGDQVGVFRKVKAQMEANVRLRMVATKNTRELINESRAATVEAMTTMVGSQSASDRFLSEDPGLVKDAVTKAFKGVIPNIASSVRKLSWEGKIAMVNGERVFVNAGRMSGIQVGDILKVMDSGEDVFDPDTGDVIGRAPGRIKGTIEVVSYFGKDGAIAVVHSGSGFKETDQVELY